MYTLSAVTAAGEPGVAREHWREENKRNKRFYHLSAAGEGILSQLLQEWNAFDASLNRISFRSGAAHATRYAVKNLASLPFLWYCRK